MGRGKAGGAAVAAGRKASEAGTMSRKAAKEGGAGVTGASPTDIESVRVAAMAQAAPGHHISLPVLREQSGLDKPTFDAVVHRLIEEGDLIGHRHDATNHLTPGQRADLVPVLGHAEPNRTHYAYVTRPHPKEKG